MEKNNTFTYENHDDIIKKIDDYILKKKPFNKNSQEGAQDFYIEYYKDKLEFTPNEIKEMLCKMNEVDDVCEDKQVKKKPLKTIRQRPHNVEGFTRQNSRSSRPGFINLYTAGKKQKQKLNIGGEKQKKRKTKRKPKRKPKRKTKKK